VNADTPLITAAQLAERLNLPVASIYKLARDGRIPVYRVPGGRAICRFSWSEIVAVLHQGGEGNGKDRAGLRRQV